MPKAEEIKIRPVPQAKQQPQQSVRSTSLPSSSSSTNTTTSGITTATTTATTKFTNSNNNNGVLDLYDDMFAQIDIDAVVRSSKPTATTATATNKFNNSATTAGAAVFDDAASSYNADVLDDALLALDFDALRAQPTNSARKAPPTDRFLFASDNNNVKTAAKPSSSSSTITSKPSFGAAAAYMSENNADDRWANEIDLDEIVQSHKQRLVLTNTHTNTTTNTTTTSSTRTFSSTTTNNNNNSSKNGIDEASLASLSLDELQSRRRDISAEVAQLRATISTIDRIINQRRQTTSTTQAPSDYDADCCESNNSRAVNYCLFVLDVLILFVRNSLFL